MWSISRLVQFSFLDPLVVFFSHISFFYLWIKGDLCREMVARKTEIGLAIEKAVVAGEFVSNRLILQMLDNRLKKDDIAMANGVIIDGFPRFLFIFFSPHQIYLEKF